MSECASCGADPHEPFCDVLLYAQQKAAAMLHAERSIICAALKFYVERLPEFMSAVDPPLDPLDRAAVMRDVERAEHVLARLTEPSDD